MHSAKKMPKTTNLFEILTYANYSKQLQATAQFFGLQDVKVTPHGARIGKAVENFNSRVLIEDIAVDGRWADLSSTISYIRNRQASFAKINMSPYMKSEIMRHAKQFTTMIIERWEKVYKEGYHKIISLDE